MKFDTKGNKVIGYYHYLDIIELTKNLKLILPDNQKKSQSITHGSDSGFRGGNFNDFMNSPNMKEFQDAKKKIEESKLDRKITVYTENKMMRRRTRSDHDGEFNFDRLWDLKPFDLAYKKPTPNKIINIKVDMSIACGTEAREINKYGNMVWAISQVIEGLGITTSIDLVNESTGTFSSRKKYSDSQTNINIKKSTEYISPISLAYCFRSVFYRMGIFNAMVFTGDRYGETACDSLGRPSCSWNEHAKFEGDTLYLKPSAIMNFELVEKEMLKVINSIVA